MDNLENLISGQPEDGEAAPTPKAEAPAAEAAPPTPDTAEAPVDETAEQKASRERDERGRFKAKDADEPVMVPLKALHETRDQVQQLRAELNQLRQPQQQTQAQPVPDIFEDPEGFVDYQNRQLHAVTLNTTLNISEEMTRKADGQETVDEAQKWGAQAFTANPAFYQQFLQQRNPYGFLVEHYKRASTFAKLGDDPSQIEAFLTWKQAQQGTPSTPAAVPSSLADQQSARGSAVPYQPPSLEQLLKG